MGSLVAFGGWCVKDSLEPAGAGARRCTRRRVSEVREELSFGRVLQRTDFGYDLSGVKWVWRLGDVAEFLL